MMRKTKRNFGKKSRRFCIVYQMNKEGEISKFQEYKTKFMDNML